jgi:HAD superfamily hydrolase (TIGR01509 family)
MAVLKAVVFDFDGVLVDSVPSYRDAVADAAGDVGIDDVDAGQIAASDTRTVARQIIKKYNLDLDVETLAQQIEEHALHRLLAGPRIASGAQELVSSLRAAGLKTAIASLGPRRNINAILREAGLEKSFDALVTIEDVQNIKPNPEIFLKAAQALGLTGKDCIAIEDSDKGISAANAAGMTTIALTTTFGADRLQHAYFIVERLLDLTLGKLRQLHDDHKGKS